MKSYEMRDNWEKFQKDKFINKFAKLLSPWTGVEKYAFIKGFILGIGQGKEIGKVERFILGAGKKGR